MHYQGEKFQQNRRRGHRLLSLTHDESVLTVSVNKLCAKFHQNRIKTATVGAMTETDRQKDASDFIICPMLCYSNRTDKNRKL